jgi:hypothetical protein
VRVSLKRATAKKDFPDDSEIEDVIQDILYPYKKTEDPVIAIQFGVVKENDEEWRQAIGFASAYNTYSQEKVGRLTKHRVEFKPDQAWEIHQLYQMLEKSPHLEIYIDDMRLPHAATLWLPLLWFYL